MFKKICALACALACVLSSAALCLPSSAEEKNGSELPYYGRQALSSLDNSAALLYAYDSIVAGVEERKEEILVHNGAYKISIEEIQMVFDAYKRDHTEHFWLENSFSVTHNDVIVNSLLPKYVFTAEELPAARIAFDSAIETVMAGLDENMSEFDKELYLHDRLASSVSYEDSDNCHNAYGAIVEGKAVCEGYAEGLQCLLRAAGIESFIIIGTGTDPETQVTEPHAWNAVRIDGKYYHTDLTWNDQGNKLYHAYFNVSTEMLLDDHSIDSAAYTLPVCNSTDAFYFEQKSGLIDEYTAYSIGKLLYDSKLTAHVYISNEVSSFINWWEREAGNVARAAGISGTFSYGHSRLGREIILMLDTCKHTQLTLVNGSAASCTEDGNIPYYYCSCGKYFQDAEGNSEILNRSSVILFSPGHVWNEAPEEGAQLKQSAEDCVHHDLYFYGCSGCDQVSDSLYFEGSATGKHLPTLVEKVAPTCTTDGKLAYYSCICGKYFEDPAAECEISDIASFGVVPPTAHADENQDGRCDSCLEVISLMNNSFLIIGGIIIGITGIVAASVMIKLASKKKKTKY